MNRAVSASALVLLFAGAAHGAFAQAASAPPPDDSSTLEEVLVTAQRREERLQDVPIPITAITSDTLAKQGAATTFDLGASVPGLVLSRATSAVQPYLRGIGTSTNSAGNDPSVAIYLDGVYLSAPMGSVFSLNNIQRIEVLKGPQGTLFGRNATAGLIHIITGDPTAQPTARASIGYGNFNTFTGNAYVSGGTDQVAADLSVTYTKQSDGWGRNTFQPSDAGTVLVQGQPRAIRAPKDEAGYNEDLGVRSKLVLRPSDRSTVKLSGMYSYTNSDQSVYRHGLPGAILTGNQVTPYVYTGKFWDYHSDAPWTGKTQLYLGAVDSAFDADIATFKSITSYLRAESFFQFPSDSTPLVSDSGSLSRYTVTTFTQEFQVLSNPETTPEWLTWIGGLYFLHSTARNDLQVVRGDIVELGQARASEQTAESYAAFGQATFQVTSSTRLTGGLRYTKDNLEAYQNTIGERTSTIPTPSVVNAVGNITGVVPDQRVSFENLSWRASVDQRINPDILLYASVSKGYKAGSFPVVSMCTDAPAALGLCRFIAPPVKPEKLLSYEVGVKSDLLDQRLRLNASAFYYDYTNLQVTSTVAASPGAPTTSLTVNAASARVYGVEVETTAVITPNFRIYASASLLDAKYEEFPNATIFVPRTAAPWANAGVIADASGRYLTKAPKFTSTVTADWTIPLSAGEVNVSGTWHHNDGMYWEPSNRLRQGAYDVLSGQVAYTFPNDKMKVRLWGKNLGNEKYYSFMTAAASGDQGAPAAPRTFGVAFDWEM